MSNGLVETDALDALYQGTTLDLLIGLTQQMVEGEFLQMEKLGRAVGEGEYYDLIYRKTACLFDVCVLGRYWPTPAIK